MPHFDVYIYLDNLKMIPFTCLADSEKDAVALVLQSEVFHKEQMKGHQLIDFTVEEAPWLDNLQKDDFLVQDSKDHEHWIITDLKNNVVYKTPKRKDSKGRGVSLLSHLDIKPATAKEDSRLKGRLLAWLDKYWKDLGLEK